MYLYTVVLMMNDHCNDRLQEAEGIIGDKGTNNLSHPGFLLLPQTVVLKVIEVQYPWHLFCCHLDWTIQMGPDILDEVEVIKRECV